MTRRAPLALPHHEGFFALAVPLFSGGSLEKKAKCTACAVTRHCERIAQIDLRFLFKCDGTRYGTMSRSMHSEYVDFERVWRMIRINA